MHKNKIIFMYWEISFNNEANEICLLVEKSDKKGDKDLFCFVYLDSR